MAEAILYYNGLRLERVNGIGVFALTHQPISCHWSLSKPSENIRLPEVFGCLRNRMKWVNNQYYYYIETSQLIYEVNQLACFYMKGILLVKWLIN